MNKSNPVVSIIMNCYNSDRFLEQAIDSIYSQTYSNWEIIFWDNASTDNSATIVQAYDYRLKYFCANKTTSLGEARNLAMRKVSGEYIAFLDCDDLYLPEKLEKQINIMKEGGYALCYGGAIVINEFGNKIRTHSINYKSGNVFDKLLKRYEINMQAVMIDRDVLASEGLEFDSNLYYSPDYNLFMKIASKHKLAIINEDIVKYRVASGSLSRKMLHMASREIKYTLDFISERNPGLRQQYNDAFNKAYIKLHYYDAIALINQGNIKEARKKLEGILFESPKYIILYMLMCIRIPGAQILRIIRR